MVVSWARAITSISKKAWTFPTRPSYYIWSFPKINRKPKTVRQRKKETYRALGQPRGEELPCRFLSCPGGSRGDILGPRGSPMWERAALQVPLSSHDLVMDWVHPGGSQHKMTVQISYSLLTMKILIMTVRKKVTMVALTDFSVFQYKFYPNP